MDCSLEDNSIQKPRLQAETPRPKIDSMQKPRRRSPEVAQFGVFVAARRYGDRIIESASAAEWELAGSCRGSETRGSRLGRTVQGNILEARAGPLWRVGGQICAGDLSCWETALTEAEPNRRGGHNFSRSTISVIHSQELDPVFGDPMWSLVTLEARRTELCQAFQQTEGIDSNENSADAATEQSEECETIYAHSGRGQPWMNMLYLVRLGRGPGSRRNPQKFNKRWVSE
ncbi:hypothetical protein C8R44DRAFT_741558 [Mycena epipterygia]|nr:hypothetical protein C8R44DRAFT_741558 [Mycena epipterygia]